MGVRCYDEVVELHQINEILQQVMQIFLKNANITSNTFSLLN